MAHASFWWGGARLVVGAEISATLPSRPTFGRDTTPNPPYIWAVPKDLDRILLKPCFDVRRGVLAMVDCLLLPGSVQTVVCLNDVRASLKWVLAESAHPALLARFVDHGLDVLHEVPYHPFPLPACGLPRS